MDIAIKVICYVALGIWLAYEIYSLVKAVKEKRKSKDEKSSSVGSKTVADDK